MPNRRKKIRSWRKGIHRENGGDKSSHKMTYSEGDGKYQVYPTLFPKKKNPSTDRKDWSEKSDTNDWDAYKTAKSRDEIVEFKSKRRAEKTAAGSWKKGKDKRKAMRDYRKSKK